MTGPACHPDGTCWRTAPGGYCLEPRCYCGACPWWRPDTAHAIAPTVLDARAVASGQRRASLESYRAAQHITRTERTSDG